ncbi:hypothetical protein T4D_6181 [Trichinella pseudospiralis]|uniref:Uncharacterized protein n=1 Tax=Trichinella pseudospiralis TaxID=6337 RepID=A0A0V1DP51_TRIPS|nr:hypothetical protein T4D_6181 [Trichinella pseudospiralis]
MNHVFNAEFPCGIVLYLAPNNKLGRLSTTHNIADELDT